MKQPSLTECLSVETLIFQSANGKIPRLMADMTEMHCATSLNCRLCSFHGLVITLKRRRTTPNCTYAGCGCGLASSSLSFFTFSSYLEALDKPLSLAAARSFSAFWSCSARLDIVIGRLQLLAYSAIIFM